MAFEHNSVVADSEPDWDNVDKTKLPRVAFADRGEPDKKSTWAYPHHWVKDGGGEDENGIYTTGTMYLHEGGLNAAWSAAQGGRSGKEASSEVKEHLDAHRKALGHDDDKEGKSARLAKQRFAASSVWAMLPEAWGGILAATEATGAPQAKVPRLPAVKGTVAILPIYGVIGQRLDWYSDASTDWLGKTLDGLMETPNIGAVILDINSPGGTIYGVPELADKIRAHTESNKKPIYAVANSEAYSAAYWIGSQATKLYVTPSGGVGSIGVWAAHVDISGFEEQLGIKTTLVKAGKYKIEGNPWEPLSEEACSEMQKRVDTYYSMFIEGVAKGRGVKTSVVRSDFGQGRTVEAAHAVEANMADGIATIDELIAGIVKDKRDRNAAALARLGTAEAALAARRM